MTTKATVTVAVLPARVDSGRIPPAPRSGVRKHVGYWGRKAQAPAIMGLRTQAYRDDQSASTRDAWWSRQSKGAVSKR